VAKRRNPKPIEHDLDCHYCGRQLTKSERTWDHIVPLALRGPNLGWNKVTSCQACNQRKADKATYREHCERCKFAWWMMSTVDKVGWPLYSTDDIWLMPDEDALEQDRLDVQPWEGQDW
jgi:HNH endonuclease